MLLHAVLERARSTGRRWTIAGALIACVATTGAVVGAAPSGAGTGTPAAAALPSGFTIQVGPEERVYGPSGLTDFPYFSEKSGKTLIGYISNNDSYRTVQTRSGLLKQPRVILKRGKAGSFDKCGAWLIGSVYRKPGTKTWIGTYHAEAAGKGDNNRCIFNDDSVVASIGRAVSFDAGKTWKKSPGGPVVTQNSAFKGPKSEDATMGRMIQVGEFLYLFYAASTGNSGDALQRRLHVARAPVSSLGARGTWKKWHCYKPSLLEPRQCDFAGTGNAGVGGESTPIAKIDPMARVIIPNTYLNKYLALSATGTLGFRLWVSNLPATAVPVDPSDPEDATKAWDAAVPFYPPVSTATDPQVDTWNRTPRAKQLYAYPSIVAENGDSRTSGQTFYIYYVKLFPGGDFPERYLMRRKVTLTKADTSGLHRVALTTYFRKSDGRRRTSTERPIENAFKPQSQNGFLLSKQRTGWVDVYECVSRGKYRLRATPCANGERNYRRVGWIRPTAGDSASVPIYTCFNRSKKNYFASSADTCGPGAKRKGLLGYGLPSAV